MAFAATTDPQEWVNRYADYLYAYAMVRLEDEEQARDLVQETFLSALESRNRFKGNSTEQTWLTAILKYKVIDAYRKKSSGLRTVSFDQEPSAEFFEADNGHWKAEYAPQPLEQKEFNTVLSKCLQKLPSLWHSVFVLKHIDEVRTETICAEMKVSKANFWVIIHRAKLNLRACLQKAGI